MRIRIILAVAILVMAGSVALAVPAFAHTTTRCTSVTTSVRLSSTSYTIRGELCRVPGDTVELLDHGASYDHNYWDGLGEQSNSYVAAANRAGYSTLAIDMLGAGQSDKPDPTLVTFPSTADVLHQIVGDLRHGPLGHYRHVVGVGHSMGAGAWGIEAGTYHDVDAVILADFTHDSSPAGVAAAQAGYRPAPGLPAGYLVVPDRSVFYNTTYADPGMMALDVSSTFSLYQAKTLSVARDPSYTRAITARVLVVVGQYDELDCNATLLCDTDQQIRDREQKYFAVRIQAFVLPKSGHDTDLHPDSWQFFLRANQFVGRVVRP